MTKMQPILAFKENKQFLSYSMVISSKIIPSRCHTSIQEWANDGFTMTSKDNRQLNFDNILSLYLETQTMKSSSLKVWSKQKRPETDMAFKHESTHTKPKMENLPHFDYFQFNSLRAHDKQSTDQQYFGWYIHYKKNWAYSGVLQTPL